MPSQSSEKGPPSPDLGYLASQMADVNMNSEKGPQTAPMSYLPEQYQYMQAQSGAPGLRGPPGPVGLPGHLHISIENLFF